MEKLQKLKGNSPLDWENLSKEEKKEYKMEVATYPRVDTALLPSAVAAASQIGYQQYEEYMDSLGVFDAADEVGDGAPVDSVLNEETVAALKEYKKALQEEL